MPVRPLVAGRGPADPLASTGRDVADTVNYVARHAAAVSLNNITVMSSPPTVSSGTTNTLSAGQRFAATNSQDAGSQQFPGSAVNLFRGGYWEAGPAFPDNQGLISRNLTGGGIPSQVNQASFYHTGTQFNLQVKGLARVLIKVDGQFVSLTPVSIPNDGNFYFVLVQFSGSATRRIDVLMYNTRFGGVWTDLVSVVQPAPPRGMKAFVVSDSFGEGAGNEIHDMWSWVTYLAEYLGWDDTTASAVGGTGLLATPGGGKVVFNARIQRDVLDLIQPGETAVVWIALSINDSTFNVSQFTPALNQILDTIQASGKNPIVVVSSPSISRGAGDVSPNSVAQNRAARQIVTSRGHIYIDTISQPLPRDFSTGRTVTTVTAPVAGGATSITTGIPLIPGTCYEFADGTRFFVRSVAGNVATVDRVQIAQASGSQLFVSGSTYLTGTGRVGATAGWGICDVAVSSDGTHPTNLGHQLLAYVCASQFVNASVNLRS